MKLKLSFMSRASGFFVRASPIKKTGFVETTLDIELNGQNKHLMGFYLGKNPLNRQNSSKTAESRLDNP
jgi:hypothetical protein